MEKKKVQKHWDLTYATYYWRLYWLQGKEYSTSSSKVWGEMEAADKDHVLFRCIEMLIRHGMIFKTHRIEIYKKRGAVIQLDHDPLIGTLYSDHYEFDQRYVVQFHNDYLREVYKAITTGQPMPAGSKYKPVRKIKNSPLDQMVKVAKQTSYASKEFFERTYQYFKSCGVAQGELEALEHAVRSAQPYLFGVVNAVQSFVQGEPKEKKLTPAAEFYKDIPGSKYYQGPNKEDLQQAADRVRLKYKDLPAGVSLKALLQMELEQARNNIKK